MSSYSNQYLSILNGMNEAVVVINFNGKIKFANKTANSLFGHFISDIFKNINGFQEKINQVKEKNSYIFDFLYTTKDNIHIPLEISSSIINIEDEKFILNVIREIKKRKMIENKLKESEDKFRSIFEQCTDGIEIFDKTGKIIEWNSGMEKLSGYSRNEVLGLYVWDMILKTSARKLNSKNLNELKKNILSVTNNFNDNNLKKYEIKYISKDKRTKYAEQKFFPIFTNKKVLIGMIFRDITDFKESEFKINKQNEELQASYEEMEAMNEEITASQENMLKTNEKLRESEERLELAMWGADEGLWDWNIKEEKVYFNNKWCLMLGYKPSEIKNDISTWKKLIHPDDYTFVMEELNKNILGKTNYYETEHRVKTKSGKWVWILDKGKVTKKDKQGNSLRMVGTHRDITKRKKMEKLIIESKNKYQTLIATVPEIIIQFNVDYKCVWLNDMGVNFFGKDITGISYKYFLVNKGEFEEDIIRLYPLAVGKTDFLHLEKEMIRQDGEKRLLELWIKPLNIENEVVGFLCSGRDITDYRKDQQKLKESNKNYFELFEKSPIGLMKIDFKGSILDINKEFLNILGITNKISILNKNIGAFFGVADKSIKEKINNVFSKGELINNEIFVKINKKEMWLRYKIEPIKIENNNILEAIFVCEDITDKKRVEEEIRYLSFHDSLTGLYNRKLVENEMESLEERQLPASIIMGDVNGLKLVNDAFGHQEGDKLLKRIAHVLKISCRSGDIIARWGGDEFILLLPKTDFKTALNICQRIKKNCSLKDRDPIFHSIALGAAVKNESDEDVFKVLKKAEDSMYTNKLLESKSIRNSILSSLESTLHERTNETREHSQRLQNLAFKFGEFLGLYGDQIDKLKLLAKLHDIGKIGIPDEILLKPRKLSNEEWEIIKKHSEIGYRIACATQELENIAELILAHHEKWDGTGYPKGLKKYDIPYLARIISIIDTYDVLTHERPYKKSISHQDAIIEIRRCAGSQFDPVLVEKFEQFMKQK